MTKQNFKQRSIKGIAIAICLAATTMFSACGDDEPGIDPNQDPSSGGITVLNPPSVNGEVCIYVYGYSDAVTNLTQFTAFSTWQVANANSAIIATGSVPAGGKQWSPVPLRAKSGGFTQSGEYVVEVNIDSEGTARYFSKVRFTNGNATIDWQNPSFDIDNIGGGGGGNSGVFTVSGYSGAEKPIFASADANVVSISTLSLTNNGRGQLGADGKVSWAVAPATGSYTLYIVTDNNAMKKTSSPVTITNGCGTVPYSAFVDIVIGGGAFTETDIVGTWEYKYGGYTIWVYEFYANKTGLTYKPIPVVGGREDEESFTWKIENGKVKTSIDASFIYVNSTKIMEESTNLEYIKKN